ncbi:amino acid permease-like [Raphidocelis subcapitata]|uniref:Amino acid permease-like n=1 Tax=Raphidocelis subcapitata TaxID=307507 RepID=A0A2V0NZA0_9CHLO|nr:amino acid permease-like [Raphidocelis subcapitata]|eukprot:GBF92649.1 amino acid permease-like [Raphidocelis subcapitata]
MAGGVRYGSPTRQARGGGGSADAGNVELAPLGAAHDRFPSETLKHSDIYAQYGLTGRRTCWQWMHAEGGWLMACFHIVTAIIGAGVLGLPHALSMLGWLGGCVALVSFFLVTIWCSFMLADMHEYDGVRHATYGDAVVNVLGRGSAFAVTVCQLLNLVLSAIGYTVAAGESLKMVVHSRCDPEEASCGSPVWSMSLVFGVLQLGFSQMPSLEAAWWASMVGAAMSVAYSTAALGMGAARADARRLSVTGRALPPLPKAFGAFNALGAIGFAYSFSAVLLEVQDTLHEPPASTSTMRKAVSVSLATTFVFYVTVGLTGYAALGDGTPGNILTGFPGPLWLVTAANFAVLVHMVPAYQVFSQPVFHMAEAALERRFKGLRSGRKWPLRLVLRSAYVVATTLVACAMPFFSDIIGLIGAIVFWPSTVYFPIAMHMKVYPPPRWKRLLMHAVNLTCFVLSILAAAGSIWNIARDAGQYKMFGRR